MKTTQVWREDWDLVQLQRYAASGPSPRRTWGYKGKGNTRRGGFRRSVDGGCKRVVDQIWAESAPGSW